MDDIRAAISDGLAASGVHHFQDRAQRSVEDNIAEDADVLARLGARNRRFRMLRLWDNDECLVVPRFFARKPGFAEAVSKGDRPVVLRASGGGTVMHGPHVVNLSFHDVAPASGGFDIARQFEIFGSLLFPVLDGLGIAAEFTPVEKAYCSGSYDIAVAGRKVAGTAGFVRTFGSMQGSVIHASIRVDHDPDEIARIETFERMIGLRRSYSGAHISCLSAELPN